MNIQDYFEYCRIKSGVTEHFPFDEDTLVFKVGGKMFALTSLSEWEKGNASINLKCDPQRAESLRSEFEDIIPGWHMSKIHWNTVAVNKRLSDSFVNDLINHSYDLVFKSLSKKIQAEIGS